MKSGTRAERKPHLSPSQLNMYTRCGEQYRRRYTEGDILPPGVAAIRGTSVHKGSEINFRQKIDSRIDLPDGEVVDQAAATFDAVVRNEGVFLSPDEESQGRRKVLGQGKDDTVRLSRLFMESGAPRIQPMEVEVQHRIELPSSTHDLLGILDVIDEEDNIRDIKTSARAKRQEDVDKDPQFTFYGLTYRAKYGKPAAGIVIDNLVLKKQPELNQIRTSRGAEDFDALIARMNVALDGIKAGVFMPADPGWWGCSPRWCGYFRTCRFVRFKSEMKDA